MLPEMLDDLSAVFRLDAYALENVAYDGHDVDHDEADRLHGIADELAERAMAGAA